MEINRGFSKAKKAQQLIEFAIVVPVLMMVLFIVIEMGAAINARTTVGEGVKMALMKVNNLSNLDGNKAAKVAFVETYIKNEVIKYLVLHNVPNSGSIIAKVKAAGDHAVVLINYEYNPYFLISGLFGTSLKTITFSSSQSLNPHVFEDNVFPGRITTANLSLYHTDGGNNPIETGALVDPDPYKDTAAAGIYDVRTHHDGSRSAFLLHFYGGIGTHPNLEYDAVDSYARLVNWQGDELLPPNLRIDLKTGTLQVRSPYYNNGVWFDTRIPYIWVISALGINHLFYVKYNSFEMLLADNSLFYYKFLFNTTDSFYNRNIRFCGTTVSSGFCNGDHRGTSTVNERALRMNPRLGTVTPGDVDSGNNDYIIGTMEPISIPSDPTNELQFVTSHYFAHTDAVAGNNPDTGTPLMEWNSANWQDNYFVAISSPRVFGLDTVTDMADEIYHPDITDTTKNPFFELYRYKFKLWETSISVSATPGTYAGVATGGADDGDIDSNNNIFPGAGWDRTEPGGDPDYTVDIVDVYIDSDGDGIPDAWDRDPAYFDVNVNGILDGNELNSANVNTNNRCNDGVGNPLNYEPDTWSACGDFPDVITSGSYMNHYNTYSGKNFYRATPYSTGLSFDSNVESGTNIPILKEMDEWYVYDPPTAGKALYFKNGSNYYRKHPTWWEASVIGCSNPDTDKFSTACVQARRKLKENFIHGTADPAGSNPTTILLDPSDELQFLYNNNVFSPTSKAVRTPPTVW